MSIRSKRLKLQAILQETTNALNELKKQCDHKGTTQCKYDGYSDPDHGSEYWIDWHCTECGHHWTTPQDDYHEKMFARIRRENRE